MQVGSVRVQFLFSQHNNIHCLLAKRKLKLGFKPVSSTESTEIRLPYCQEKGVRNLPSLTLTLALSAFCLVLS